MTPDHYQLYISSVISSLVSCSAFMYILLWRGSLFKLFNNSEGCVFVEIVISSTKVSYCLYRIFSGNVLSVVVNSDVQNLDLIPSTYCNLHLLHPLCKCRRCSYN